MPTAQTPHIGPDGTPTFLLRRLAAVDWAQSAELVVVPTPPWETDDSWRQLYHDSRQLLLYLTSLCDLDTGWVDFQPEQWASALNISVEQVGECIEILCAWDLAYSNEIGDPAAYAVQLPRRAPSGTDHQ